MKKTVAVFILIFTLFLSACSDTDPSEVLEEPYYTFSLGFEGKDKSSKAYGNQLELVATYASNEKGNILENNQVTIEGYTCTIDSLNPQSFQLGQNIKISVSCSESFDEAQVAGTIILEYLQGSTRRLAQGEFLLTVVEE